MTLDGLLKVKKAVKSVGESIIISACMVAPLYLGLNLSSTPEQLVTGITEGTAYVTTIKVMFDIYQSRKNKKQY